MCEQFLSKEMGSLKNIERNADVLSVLARSSPKLRTAIVKNCSDECIKSMCEICHNVLRGNLPLKSTKHLRKHRHVLRRIDACCIKKKHSSGYSVHTSKARKIFSQNGGIFPVLTALLPLMGKALLGGVVGGAGSAVASKVIGSVMGNNQTGGYSILGDALGRWGRNIDVGKKFVNFVDGAIKVVNDIGEDIMIAKEVRKKKKQA